MGVYPHGRIDRGVSGSQGYRFLARFQIDSHLDDLRHPIRFGPSYYLVAVEIELAKVEMAIRKGSLWDGYQSTTFDLSSPASRIPSSSISFNRSSLVASP